MRAVADRGSLPRLGSCKNSARCIGKLSCGLFQAFLLDFARVRYDTCLTHLCYRAAGNLYVFLPHGLSFKPDPQLFTTSLKLPTLITIT
jgi:hypothetical protein